MPEEMDPQTKALWDRIGSDFGYHPATEETKGKHEVTRAKFFELACYVVLFIPAGRDQSLCLTALEDAAMRANKAIAMTAPLELR